MKTKIVYTLVGVLFLSISIIGATYKADNNKLQAMNYNNNLIDSINKNNSVIEEYKQLIELERQKKFESCEKLGRNVPLSLVSSCGVPTE